jgi:hypothetical protein
MRLKVLAGFGQSREQSQVHKPSPARARHEVKLLLSLAHPSALEAESATVPATNLHLSRQGAKHGGKTRDHIQDRIGSSALGDNSTVWADRRHLSRNWQYRLYRSTRSPRVTEEHSKLGAFARFTIRVRRECSDLEGRDAAIRECRDLHILTDAARVFWQFFEVMRESDLRDNSLAGYPVARAEEIQDNTLVRTCSLECSYDGVQIRSIPLSSHPAIQITENAWKNAARRLPAREEVSQPISFVLDAAYFAESDPIRAIIMACAA